jgi:hypothetical protein
MKTRTYLIPLQALAAVLVCIGVVWLIYTVSFMDPNPPSALQINPASTSELIPNLSTAAALAAELLQVDSSPIAILPVTGDNPTVTVTFTVVFVFPTITGQPILVTATPSSPFLFPSPTKVGDNPAPTIVPSSTFTFTPTRTNTPVPTPTFTATSTPSPVPTPTNTPIPPTDTPIPPTSTPIPPTSTPIPPTSTPIPPTSTTTPPPSDTPETPTDPPDTP